MTEQVASANVVYWTTSTAAALIVIGFPLFMLFGPPAPSRVDDGHVFAVLVMAMPPAALIYLFGRAVRYIVAGR